MHTLRDPRIPGRLTEAQKLRLLCELSALNDPEMTAVGVPPVTVLPLYTGADTDLPAPVALTRSWEPALLFDVATALARRRAAAGADLVMLPGAAAADASNGDTFAEEPLLSGTLAGAFLRGTEATHLSACLTDSGAATDPATVETFYRDAYRLAVQSGLPFALITTPDSPLLTLFAPGEATPYILLSHTDESQTVIAVSRGHICMDGSASALQGALHTYRRLHAAMEHGKVTSGELAAAMEAGEAISEEQVEQALLHLLTFADACASRFEALRADLSAPPTPPITAPTIPVTPSVTTGTTVTDVVTDTPVPEAPAAEEASVAPAISPVDPSVADPAIEPTDALTVTPMPAVEMPTKEPLTEMPVPEVPVAESPVPEVPVAETAPGGDPTAPLTPDTDIARSELPAFLHRLFDKTPPPPPVNDPPVMDPLSLRAFLGSTILLDNRETILPLTGGRKVALIGVPAMSEADIQIFGEQLGGAGHTFMGYARGFDLQTERDDALIDEALRLGMAADTLLIFLDDGTVGDAPPRPRLPANRLALYDRLIRLGRKTVLVLSAGRGLDMSFITRAPAMPTALLLSPWKVTGGVSTALSVILGRCEPAGRLTETLTDHRDIAATRLPTAPAELVGYRYYDKLGYGATYPFGHGLSLTDFAYSDARVEGSELLFTVTNIGARSGVAVPQVYCGSTTPTATGPRRLLTGFTSVSLLPGEARSLRLPCLSPGMAGDCTVYLGRSVEDTVLSLPIALPGTMPAPAVGDFPPVSNILSEHYTMEAVCTLMKSSLRNPIFGIAALALSASVALYDFFAAPDTVFLKLIAAVLAMGAVLFFMLELYDRKHRLSQNDRIAESVDAIIYRTAEEVSVISASTLFAEAEAEELARTREQAAREEAEARAEEHDLLADVDKTLTFTEAARELTVLAAEKGLLLDPATAQSLFASMATARLVVVRGMDSAHFERLMALLAEYFGALPAIDRVDDSYTDESAVLFTPDGSSRGAHVAMESATRDPGAIRLVGLDDVRWQNLSAYFVPYARYARAPLSDAWVAVQGEDGMADRYRIPANVWFFLNLHEGETLAAIPDYIAEIAPVEHWTVEFGEPSAASHREFRRFGYGQMLFMTDKRRGAYILDEDTWKKIDRVEAFAARFGEFNMGNKLTIGMETYLAVYAEYEADAATALDRTLAVKLLPAVIRTLHGKLSRDERGLGETLDALFGDDHTAACRHLIKQSGAELF